MKMAIAAATLRAMALGGIAFITAGMAAYADLPMKEKIERRRRRNLHKRYVKKHDYRRKRQESMHMKGKSGRTFTSTYADERGLFVDKL